MAFEVIKVYKEEFPALRFIGRRYTDDDRKDGGFGEKWGEWWSQDRFGKMKTDISYMLFDESPIGLMTMHGDMTGFTYWIGLFFPAGTHVPEGYDYLDLPASNIGVGWIRGKEENGEIYGGPPHGAVCDKLAHNGIGDFRNDIAGNGSDTLF